MARRPGQAPTMVMLHEGLGCVALWRDFPAELAAATGHGVFAYSRAGYGGSEPPPSAPPARLHEPRGADPACPRFSTPSASGVGLLLGHSDGASIAAIYAGETAPTSGSRASS